MRTLKKFIRKFLPRFGAFMLAAACCVGAYAAAVFFLYKPERNDNVIPFDTSARDPSEKEVDTPPNDEAKDTHYNFLVLGHDRAASLTDVIILISYDIEKQSISMLQIPRDTYVELEDYSYHKINGAYNYYVSAASKSGSSNPEKDGCRGFASFLETNLCIKIHYCAVMDLDGFAGIVEAIGGVDMYVPQDMYYNDPGQNLYINLREGYQHLNGKTAEQFVRYRMGYANADIGRGNAQKLFIAAFIKKLQSSVSDLSVLKNLAANVITHVDTDITVNDILYFGKNFLGLGSEPRVDMGNIRMQTMPGTPKYHNGVSYYIMNKAAVADIINGDFNIYGFDILSSFDPKQVFVAEDSIEIRNLYLADKSTVTTDVYDASSLNNQGGTN